MTKQHDFKRTIDFIYNPDNQTKEELIASFVVRLKTFDRLISDIKKSKMKSPEQHYLIEGKRGMGKTTMLLRLGYEIENTKTLNSWLIPIVFNEEEYSIRRLYKLWERIARLLEEKNNDFIGLYDEMDESFASYESPEEYEYGIFNLLKKRLEAKGKKLILFIDNFGDIFSKFNKQEIQRLRTVLQSDTNFRIIGASSTVLEAFYDEKHPFYEFFKVVRLRGLDKEETNGLLLKLGETYKHEEIKDILLNQQGRVESLRRLTGGVIRTIVLLFEIFIDKKQGSAFSDLEAILDRVTPLYKHRMDDLPAQQQEIIEAIAFAWDAVNVSEISTKTRIVSKTVSAQLRQMEKNEIITKKLTNNKNHFYQISERFFNIWYLMRHGRKGDKSKVLWLVRFLEDWCDEGELIARAQKHISFLKNGKYDVKGAYYLTEALASTKSLPKEKQDELIKTTREFLNKNKSDFAKYLSESEMELYEKAMKLYEESKYTEALDYFLKMKDKDFFRMGYCYDMLNDLPNAEQYYLTALDNDDDIVFAMNNLAVLYNEKKNDLKKAEQYYLMAIEKGYEKAMFNLAILCEDKKNDLTKAEQYYLMAVEKGVGKAMNNLAYLYEKKQNDLKKAEQYYLMGVEEGDEKAMNNLADLYYYQKVKNISALELAKKAYIIENNDLFRLTLAKILLWNNQIIESIEIAEQFLYDENYLAIYLEFFNNYLFLLLAKEQYQFLYDYFTSPKAEELNIKDQLKPIWYALMYYMQDEFPNEFLRMGEELEETVKEIIAEVEQMRIDYT